MSERSNPVVDRIAGEARGVYERIRQRSKPQMKLPIRSLANVRYRPQAGYFQLNGRSKVRTMTVGTVKTFAQSLKMMAMSKELISRPSRTSGGPPIHD